MCQRTAGSSPVQLSGSQLKTDLAPLSPWKKKMNFGQDRHPGPARMGAQAGRGAARPSSIPGRREGAGCDRLLRVFMLVRKRLKPPHCMNLLCAEGGKGRGGGEVNPSTCFPCPDPAAASRGVARRRMSQKRGRLRKV